MKNYIDTKVEEFKERNDFYMEEHSCCFNYEKEEEWFRKSLTDILDKVQSECVPEEKTPENEPRESVAEVWNSCRQTFINKLDTLRK